MCVSVFVSLCLCGFVCVCGVRVWCACLVCVSGVRVGVSVFYFLTQAGFCGRYAADATHTS